MQGLDSKRTRAKLQHGFISFVLEPWWRCVRKASRSSVTFCFADSKCERFFSSSFFLFLLFFPPQASAAPVPAHRAVLCTAAGEQGPLCETDGAEGLSGGSWPCVIALAVSGLALLSGGGWSLDS